MEKGKVIRGFCIGMTGACAALACLYAVKSGDELKKSRDVMEEYDRAIVEYKSTAEYADELNKALSDVEMRNDLSKLEKKWEKEKLINDKYFGQTSYAKTLDENEQKDFEEALESEKEKCDNGVNLGVMASVFAVVGSAAALGARKDSYLDDDMGM